MKPLAIDARHLKKQYRLANPVPALNDCSLQVEQGKLVCITGPSGCGKTTLLLVLAGMLPFDAGTVYINGIHMPADNPKACSQIRKHHIGMVSQVCTLLEENTVLENILLPFHIQKKPVEYAYVQQLMELLDISSLQDRFPWQLSGGQQQRVAIARALACRPSVVLADEPTGNLDHASALQVMALFRQVQKVLHQTVLLVSHDLDLAMQADEILYMEDGRLQPWKAGTT